MLSPLVFFIVATILIVYSIVSYVAWVRTSSYARMMILVNIMVIAPLFILTLDLDENTLRHLAQSTGGLYLRAKNTEALANVYTELDRLEPASTDTELFRPRTELYIWPLSLALALSVLMAISLLVPNGFPVGTRWLAKNVDPRPLVGR